MPTPYTPAPGTKADFSCLFLRRFPSRPGIRCLLGQNRLQRTSGAQSKRLNSGHLLDGASRPKTHRFALNETGLKAQTRTANQISRSELSRTIRKTNCPAESRNLLLLWASSSLQDQS